VLAEALSKLYERIPLGMRLGLGPMIEACARRGNPERSFASVHVAGTNGKGSVSAMVESIARAHGLKVGLYTSPHLCRFAERIRIDGAPIEDGALAEVLHEVLDGAPDLSFFEAATLAAFVAFRQARVDLAVVEVGLGGRLDATNVLVKPAAAAITRIALDHTDRLGPTLVDIAREKAGIAKPGLEIVVGPMKGEVRAAIDEVAHSNGATTIEAEGEDTRRDLSGGWLPLAGEHQIRNAAIAYRLGKQLGFAEEAILRGLRETRWPGRLEVIERPDGPYLLDAAHNPDGAEALAHHLEASKRVGGQVDAPGARFRGVLVFGALADKAWPAMIDRLGPLFPGGRVYVSPQGRAAAAPSAIAARSPGKEARSVGEALALARVMAPPGSLVVVAGSIFLVGEARAALLSLPFDRTVAL
jgi:dihydrofolate synthase/folylpolyglutamate synthase